jgi:hypothetical protein
MFSFETLRQSLQPQLGNRTAISSKAVNLVLKVVEFFFTLPINPFHIGLASRNYR